MKRVSMVALTTIACSTVAVAVLVVASPEFPNSTPGLIGLLAWTIVVLVGVSLLVGILLVLPSIDMKKVFGSMFRIGQHQLG